MKVRKDDLFKEWADMFTDFLLVLIMIELIGIVILMIISLFI